MSMERAAAVSHVEDIVDTVERAITTETPTEKRASLTDADVESWATQRHEQIDDGDLVYVAHNLDHLVRFP